MISPDYGKTPVIIPAHNEASVIARTLSALPAHLVEPIVAANDCTDTTVEIAKSFGATVYDYGEQGKLPAVQNALRELGRNALEPLLILDADTYPAFPEKWARGMTNSLIDETLETPQATGGPVIYTGKDVLNCTLRSARRIQRALASQHNPSASTISQCGPNMGIHLKQPEILDQVLAMPHYWPSEDRALASLILDAEGTYRQPVGLATVAVSPASVSFLSLQETRELGLDAARQKMLDLYADRGAPGSIPFEPNETED